MLQRMEPYFVALIRALGLIKMLKITDILDVKKYVMEYKAVIFDLDDTLYSEKEYVRSGYKQIAEICPQIDNMYLKLWNAFQNGERAIDFVLKNENLYSDKFLLNCLKVYREQEPKICLYPGVTDMLSDFKNRGLKLGIITDGRPIGQHAKIKALGLEKYFDKIIITDELGGVKFRKPNPQAFIVMKKFFNVKYSEMVYIGDNIKKDFKAPDELGMAAIFFENYDGLYQSYLRDNK